MMWKRLRRSIKILLLAAFAVLLAYQLWIAAWLAWWEGHNPESTAIKEARLSDLREKNQRAELQQRWLPYAQISPKLKRAVIAAEDAKFMQHDGFDRDGMHVSFEKNLLRGRIVAFGSTISQQLAKNIFLSGHRNILRKAEEAYITALMEQMMDKRRILEIYLNVVVWGVGVFGVVVVVCFFFGVGVLVLCVVFVVLFVVLLL